MFRAYYVRASIRSTLAPLMRDSRTPDTCPRDSRHVSTFITHVILSDNGTEFRNAVLNELCTQFRMKHFFITAYHPAANGLAGGANREILQVRNPIVIALLDTWEV